MFVLSEPGCDDNDELLACSESSEVLKVWAANQAKLALEWSDYEDGSSECYGLDLRIRRVEFVR